ncbi:MAG: hypothetical protein IPH06_00455 [Alphaproteobacteria bacterium]|jgi:hypothetical protein|nr:hypothetical protein [Alphaproteobacteria bacterium]QQS56544.1 MAG: hypothetical protein IPN28_09705 [Alphaproteobacteria bacterium]
MNKSAFIKGFTGFGKQLFADSVDYYKQKVFLVISIGVFILLFVNTFFVYQWCHIDSETLLLSCKDHGLDTFFNYMTSHVLYQMIFNYGQLEDGYTFFSVYSLIVSAVVSGLFIVGFLTLSFSIFNLPWRLFDYIKENYYETEQDGNTESD